MRSTERQSNATADIDSKSFSQVSSESGRTVESKLSCQPADALREQKTANGSDGMAPYDSRTIVGWKRAIRRNRQRGKENHPPGPVSLLRVAMLDPSAWSSS